MLLFDMCSDCINVGICYLKQNPRILCKQHVVFIKDSYRIDPMVFQERMVDVKGTTESRKTPMQPSMSMRSPGECVRAEESEEASPSGSKLGGQQGWLSHTSLRRLQVLHTSKLKPAQREGEFSNACFTF